MKFALAGNPNCGKTTMFNALTGKKEKVGNWAGVTVEKKIAKMKKKYNPINEDIFIVDLPGAYGINAYTDDEQEAVDFIKNENIDVLVNIIDSLNLERSLKFTLELKELGLPMIGALNKYDRVLKKNLVDVDLLEEMLGFPVIPTKANKSKGLKELMSKAVEIGKM